MNSKCLGWASRARPHLLHTPVHSPQLPPSPRITTSHPDPTAESRALISGWTWPSPRLKTRDPPPSAPILACRLHHTFVLGEPGPPSEERPASLPPSLSRRLDGSQPERPALGRCVTVSRLLSTMLAAWLIYNWEGLGTACGAGAETCLPGLVASSHSMIAQASPTASLHEQLRDSL